MPSEILTRASNCSRVRREKDICGRDENRNSFESRGKSFSKEREEGRYVKFLYGLIVETWSLSGIG